MNLWLVLTFYSAFFLKDKFKFIYSKESMLIHLSKGRDVLNSTLFHPIMFLKSTVCFIIK